MNPIIFTGMGADPEVFLVNNTGNPVSSIGKIGGTKKKPIPMLGLPDGFCVQEDNVAAEFNIPVADTAAQFSANIKQGLAYLQRMVKKQHNLKVACLAALHFSPEDLEHPMAQRLGCDPDFNAWTMEQNPRPTPPATLRTAAGHIHVGWRNPTKEQASLLVRMIDLELTVPSILVTDPNERRSLYGKAGACRPKPYGVEYRTLDNFWLPKDSYRKHVFNTVMDVIGQINEDPEVAEDIILDHGELIQECINSHDRDLAVHLVSSLELCTWPNK